jgi:hypothetical protein
MDHRVLAIVALLYSGAGTGQDRILDDFTLIDQIPPTYTLSTTPTGTPPSMTLVDDPMMGRVLEVRGAFSCANLAEPAVGARPDEPDCAEDFVVLKRTLVGPVRASFQGFGAWLRASAGIEFRLRIARVESTTNGFRLV